MSVKFLIKNVSRYAGWVAPTLVSDILLHKSPDLRLQIFLYFIHISDNDHKGGGQLVRSEDRSHLYCCSPPLDWPRLFCRVSSSTQYLLQSPGTDKNLPEHQHIEKQIRSKVHNMRNTALSSFVCFCYLLINISSVRSAIVWSRRYPPSLNNGQTAAVIQLTN